MKRSTLSRICEYWIKLETRSDGPWGGLLRHGRSLLARWVDPPIAWRVGHFDLLMPFSHMFPRYSSNHSDYSRNIGRVAKAVSASDGAPPLIVDIGANVGDTVAIIASECDARFLCVEPEPTFRKYLAANLTEMGVNAITDSHLITWAGKHSGSFIIRSGTARFVSDANEQPIASATLNELESTASIGTPRIVKLDTDGMDISILAGNLEYLKINRPILFFECDAHFAGIDHHAILSLLSSLADVEYAHAVAFHNTGPLLGSFSIGDNEQRLTLSDLIVGLSSTGGFCDLLVVPKHDPSWPEIYRTVVDGERE